MNSIELRDVACPRFKWQAKLRWFLTGKSIAVETVKAEKALIGAISEYARLSTKALYRSCDREDTLLNWLKRNARECPKPQIGVPLNHQMPPRSHRKPVARTLTPNRYSDTKRGRSAREEDERG